MTAFYDSKPSALEALGNGSYRYRWNITEVTRPATEDGMDTGGTQWTCHEVDVWEPLTADKLKEAVLAEAYGQDKELKLVNEYNSYQLGVSGDDTTEAYKGYLKERSTLKRGVDDALDAYRGKTITEGEALSRAKEKKQQEIYEYDKSKKVDGCYIRMGGALLFYWSDKVERSCLKQSLSDCVAEGITTYRLDLRDEGVSVELGCEQLLAMLRQLEVYAIKCYNKTTDHLFAVQALTDAAEVEAYDYTVGYPELPIFEIS